MKKVIVLVLCIAMVISITACSSDVKSTDTESADTSQETTETATENEAATTDTGTEMSFEGQSITLGVWGGSFKEAIVGAYVKPFETLTGAQINIEEYSSDVLAKVKTQVEQDLPGFDLVSGIGAVDFVALLAGEGALQKIDYSKLPNTENILTEGKYEYGVGGYMCAQNIMYLADDYPNGGPTTAAEFFDVETYPGPRSINSFTPSSIMEQALLADGVAKEDLYPLDVERAFAKLDTIKPYITKWWGSGADIFQALSDGEATSGIYWIAHGFRAQNAGVDVVISMDDAAFIADCWAIPANAENQDLVYAFLNFANDPQQVAIFTRMLGYAPLIPEAMDYLTDEEIQKMTSYPENEEKGFWLDTDYWTENYGDLTERYLEWIAS